MEEKKYELLNTDTIVVNDKTLYRIRALKDILFYDESSIGADDNVHTGDLGGYIECEGNLSHDGNAWVYDDSYVYEAAKVYGNARVCKKSRINGWSSISGNALVEHTYVHDMSDICEDAKVYDSHISISAKIYGKATIADSFIYGEISICDFAHLNDASLSNKGRIYGRVKISHVKLYGDDTEICGNSRIMNAVIHKNIFMSTGDICFCQRLEIHNDIIIDKASDFIYMENVGEFPMIMFYVSKDSKICFDAYIYDVANVFLKQPYLCKSGTIEDLLKKNHTVEDAMLLAFVEKHFEGKFKLNK
jgi:UDP-3-O-[3-hydroxymyristoyl] glucosamine N-acyltransferase